MRARKRPAKPRLRERAETARTLLLISQETEGIRGDVARLRGELAAHRATHETPGSPIREMEMTTREMRDWKNRALGLANIMARTADVLEAAAKELRGAIPTP